MRLHTLPKKMENGIIEIPTSSLLTTRDDQLHQFPGAVFAFDSIQYQIQVAIRNR